MLCCNNFFKSKGERILRILEAKAFWILLLSVVLLQLVIFLTSYKQYLVPQSCVINFFAVLQSLNEPNRYQNVIYIYIIYNIYIYIYIIYIYRERLNSVERGTLWFVKSMLHYLTLLGDIYVIYLIHMQREGTVANWRSTYVMDLV